MACGSCGSRTSFTLFEEPVYSSAPQTTENCPFTLEMLNNFKVKLRCLKEEALYESLGLTETKVNSYLGIVISSINYRVNYCRFEKELEKVQDVIIQMINLNIC